ncbi:hypothetical protein VNO77_15153 [Canavalia gladiata]|uniref:Uncharacterized protein n=1 Tax=Canavalia gladiata TaxID=3824 RepID=A0AAN9M427_CANGL
MPATGTGVQSYDQCAPTLYKWFESRAIKIEVLGTRTTPIYLYTPPNNQDSKFDTLLRRQKREDSTLGLDQGIRLGTKSETLETQVGSSAETSMSIWSLKLNGDQALEPRSSDL